VSFFSNFLPNGELNPETRLQFDNMPFFTEFEAGKPMEIAIVSDPVISRFSESPF
jgi:hypothetical protein